MISFPKNIPQHLRETFSNAVGLHSINETMQEVNQGVCSLFKATSAFLYFERLNAQETAIDKHSVTHGTLFCDNVLSEEWFRSGIHDSAKHDLQQRLSAISHSSYSWPYPSISNEYADRILFPAGYTILIPYSSSLIVKPENDANFFGYIALFFESFPDLDEEVIGLIISLPSFLSEFTSALLRHYEASTVQGNALAHDFKQYVLLNRQLVYRAQESLKKKKDDVLSILRRMDASASRMLTLTSQVLLADRDYSGTLVVRPIEVELNSLIEEVLSEVEPRFELRKVKLESCFDPEVKTILLDPAIFPSVLNNLLDNALKYSVEAGVVQVTTFRVDEEHITVRVIDEGIGVPEKDRKKIFDKHFRAGNTKQKGGNGLGLYLVKKIVEAHNGSIYLSDDSTRKTIFEILLPIDGLSKETKTKEDAA